jgi:hypothetical protein
MSLFQSGRDFLQDLADRHHVEILRTTFFESLKSKRRLALLSEILAQVQVHMRRSLPDPFAAFTATKYATGHLYALCLRSHCVTHLTVSDQVGRKKEHDMRALKRQDIVALRQGAAKGRKVLYIWDRAGIDFRQWFKWKESGIYFLSREKENMKLEIVALLYKCRWDVEKVFDEFKNKLGETKSWASTANAKTCQARLLCHPQPDDSHGGTDFSRDRHPQRGRDQTQSTNPRRP